MPGDPLQSQAGPHRHFPPKAATSNVIAVIIVMTATKAHTMSLARFVFVSWIRRTRSQNQAEKPCSTAAQMGVLSEVS